MSMPVRSAQVPAPRFRQSGHSKRRVGIVGSSAATAAEALGLAALCSLECLLSLIGGAGERGCLDQPDRHADELGGVLVVGGYSRSTSVEVTDSAFVGDSAGLS